MSVEPRVSYGTRHTASQAVKYVVAIGIAAIILIPLLAAVMGGFKTNAQLLANPFGIPNPLVTSNYTDVLTNPSFWRQLLNSTMVMLATSVGVVVLASMVAFVFARVPFRGASPVRFLQPGTALPDHGGHSAALHYPARPGPRQQPVGNRHPAVGVRLVGQHPDPEKFLLGGSKRPSRRRRAWMASPPLASSGASCCLWCGHRWPRCSC